MNKTNIDAMTTISWIEYHWYVVSLCRPKCLWAAGTSFINMVHNCISYTRRIEQVCSWMCQNIDCYTVQTFIHVGKALIHVDLRGFKKLCHLNKHSITRNAYKNKLFLRVAYFERHEMKSMWFTEIFHFRSFSMKSCSCNHSKKGKKTHNLSNFGVNKVFFKEIIKLIKSDKKFVTKDYDFK